jgi:hypothetical protein
LIELLIVSFASSRLCVNSVPADAAPDGAWKILPGDFLQICRTYGAKKLDSFQSKFKLTA